MQLPSLPRPKFAPASRMRYLVTGLEFLDVSKERNAFFFKSWRGPTKILYISSKCLKWLSLVLLLLLLLLLLLKNLTEKNVPPVNTGRYHDRDRKLLSGSANSQIVTSLDLHVWMRAAVVLGGHWNIGSCEQSTFIGRTENMCWKRNGQYFTTSSVVCR